MRMLRNASVATTVSARVFESSRQTETVAETAEDAVEPAARAATVAEQLARVLVAATAQTARVVTWHIGKTEE